MAWLRVGNERPCTDWNEIVFLSMSDKLAVVELRERAQQLMEAAEAAAAKGVLCSETTVLVRHDGSIHMAMDSDWPLESLRADRGADTAYRVVVNAGKISVEACDLRHRICIQVATTRKIAQIGRAHV